MNLASPDGRRFCQRSWLSGEKNARSRNWTAVGDFEAYTSLWKNSCAVRQVAALNSSSEQFLTCATVSEISFTNAGSQRWPRWGTGARYGQSVSSMNLSGGAAATASRTFCEFLKVTMPVKLTSEPMARICSSRSTDSPKQWKTPRTLPANGLSCASVSSNEARWWMTQFSPDSAATSSC